MADVKDKPRNYGLRVGGGAVKLYINGILHLSIKRDELLAVQSWEKDGMFFIEYTTRSRDVLTEYNKVDKWKAILKLIDETKIFT